MKKQFVIVKWLGNEPIMTDLFFERRSEAEKTIEEWFENEKIEIREKVRYKYTIDKVYSYEQQ